MSRSINIFSILAVVCVVLTSCSNSGTDNIHVEQLERYNRKIETAYQEKESWVNAPLSIAIELTRAGQVAKETHISMLQLNTGEVARKVKVTINEEGVLGDSSPSTKSTLYLEKVNEKWQVVQNLEED